MSAQTKQTRRMVIIAILSALSFVLMSFGFPIIPGADFLKVELSVIPVLIGLVLMDLKSAYAILLLRTLLKLILKNGGVNDFIGLPMNIIALGTFVTIFALLWNKTKTSKSFIISSLMGTVSLTLVMLVLNYVYAVPLYAKFAGFDIAAVIGVGKYLINMVLPFNLIQGLIFAIVFGLVYSTLKSRLKKI